VARIELETAIAAPVERCFDLSLSVDLHLRSAANTGERVVAGPTRACSVRATGSRGRRGTSAAAGV
jgi:hypothetical protein